MKQEKIWDALAKGWSGWRNKPLKEIEKLTGEWNPGKLLDIGCGNCRNLIPFAKSGFDCYGIDFSKEMLKQAKGVCEKENVKVNLKLSRAEKLPFKNELFDYCIFANALHHVDTAEGRKKAVSEMFRVMKKEGRAFVSVWNKLQPRFFFAKKDVFIPWNKKDKTYQRYYHLFSYFELRKLLKSAGFKIMRSSGIFGKSLWFIAEK